MLVICFFLVPVRDSTIELGLENLLPITKFVLQPIFVVKWCKVGQLILSIWIR